MINGSPHTDGNTALALKEMGKVFAGKDFHNDRGLSYGQVSGRIV